MNYKSKKHKQYGIGRNYFGIWLLSTKIENSYYKSFRVSLFPLDVYVIFENSSFCFRVKLFRHITMSSMLEVN
tara:strand:- start:333 stop:551 length:219 start_codon:yes stop_codon:yes gene_type:complete